MPELGGFAVGERQIRGDQLLLQMSLRRSANCWSTNVSALPAEEAVPCECVSWATAPGIPNAQIAMKATTTRRRLFTVSPFLAGDSSPLQWHRWRGSVGCRPTTPILQAACQRVLVCLLQTAENTPGCTGRLSPRRAGMPQELIHVALSPEN
jgi:hypothetical protein